MKGILEEKTVYCELEDCRHNHQGTCVAHDIVLRKEPEGLKCLRYKKEE